MLQEKEKVLEKLAQLFLSYRDPNMAYCKLKTMLYAQEVDISMEEVQSRAYRCEEKEVK